MKYKVHHADNPTFSSKFDPHQTYTIVAVVEANSLEEVFYLTNTIEDLWWENPGVECLVPSRSTSVGDIVENENGILFLCSAVGWTELK